MGSNKNLWRYLERKRFVPNQNLPIVVLSWSFGERGRHIFQLPQRINKTGHGHPLPVVKTQSRFLWLLIIVVVV